MQCEEVRELATTRVALGLVGDYVYHLQGLHTESGSVNLFLDRAEAIGGGDGELDRASPELLLRLVDKSMLVPGIADKLGRCRMLDTVREFATVCLGRAAEVEATTRRHAHHYLAFVERAAPHLRTP